MSQHAPSRRDTWLRSSLWDTTRGCDWLWEGVFRESLLEEVTFELGFDG